jgi:hypothetical protein
VSRASGRLPVGNAKGAAIALSVPISVTAATSREVVIILRIFNVPEGLFADIQPVGYPCCGGSIDVNGAGGSATRCHCLPGRSFCRRYLRPWKGSLGGDFGGSSLMPADGRSERAPSRTLLRLGGLPLVSAGGFLVPLVGMHVARTPLQRF